MIYDSFSDKFPASAVFFADTYQDYEILKEKLEDELREDKAIVISGTFSLQAEGMVCFYHPEVENTGVTYWELMGIEDESKKKKGQALSWPKKIQHSK